ncbi:MAG: ABC transporter substrate-binding protein [Bacteroidota bacterium]
MRYILFIGWIFLLAANQGLAQDGYKQIRSDQIRIIDGKSFYVHLVKKGQTLYSIAKAYDVEMQDVIDANPVIKNGLKANQTLMIPTPEEELPIELPYVVEPVVIDPTGVKSRDEMGEDPVSPRGDYLNDQLPCVMMPESSKEVYNVALMMHFFLKEADSINTESPSQKEIESYNSLRYIQFYEGFLLAVDSLRKTGLNLNLYVYDVDPNASGTYAFLKKPEMKKMDLIIGMLFHRNFEIVASWARDRRIPVVSPISERESQVEGNPMVIKVRPSYTSEGIALAEYLSQNHYYSHTLLTHSWEPEVRTMANQIYANCLAMGLDVSMVDQENLIHRLNRGVENIVVVVSTQKPYALNILSQLNADMMGYTFTVFGLPRWDQFEGMDYEYLEKARAHILVPSWIDYNNPEVQRLVMLFRETYKTDPDNLAFQGYDVAWYFLNALQRYGTAFTDCLREITIRTLQTVYKFRQQNGDGWENHHWEIFHYDNYSLTPLN